MEQKIVFRSFGTHDGSFHADEVTACALLILFDCIDKDRILRTRCKKELSRCEYVCDVGGEYAPDKKRFDHHQTSYKGELSSAGMVLCDLTERGQVSPRLYHYLNRSLVQGVDAVDTGRAPPIEGHCSFSGVIANFVPANYEASRDEMESAFQAALAFTCGHVRRLIDRFAYMETCRDAIKQAMEEGQEVLMFKRSMPWLEIFFDLGGEEHPAQFVIMPAGNQWKLRAIPPSYRERMGVRTPLPKEWAGLIGKELQEKTAIAGAVFCHKGRFISIWETEGDAKKALAYVLREEAK